VGDAEGRPVGVLVGALDGNALGLLEASMQIGSHGTCESKKTREKFISAPVRPDF
jgi:hypothetical protein